MDKIVKAKPGNESYITGTFLNNQIVFKKRYKFHLSTDGDHVVPDDLKFDGVDYTGALFTRFFSREKYFSGTWSIRAVMIGDVDARWAYMCYGKWTMKRSAP